MGFKSVKVSMAFLVFLSSSAMAMRARVAKMAQRAKMKLSIIVIFFGYIYYIAISVPNLWGILKWQERFF
jgi:hypothetical protein